MPADRRKTGSQKTSEKARTKPLLIDLSQLDSSLPHISPDELAACKINNMTPAQRAAYDTEFRDKAHYRKVVSDTHKRHAQGRKLWREYTLLQSASLAQDAPMVIDHSISRPANASKPP